MTESLRSVAELERSIRNYSLWIGDAASGGMDVDFLVERKGNFLFIEGKPWQNGVVVNYGQHLTLLRLSQQPSTTVLLVGEAKDSMYLHEYGPASPPGTKHKGRLRAYFWPKLFTRTDLDGLRSYVADWWISNDAR